MTKSLLVPSPEKKCPGQKLILLFYFLFAKSSLAPTLVSLKPFHFVQPLQAPFELLDGMLFNS